MGLKISKRPPPVTVFIRSLPSSMRKPLAMVKYRLLLLAICTISKIYDTLMVNHIGYIVIGHKPILISPDKSQGDRQGPRASCLICSIHCFITGILGFSFFFSFFFFGGARRPCFYIASIFYVFLYFTHIILFSFGIASRHPTITHSSQNFSLKRK